MLLTSVYLQRFRNYSNQKFDFSPNLTIVVGRNTAGKTNLSESIHLLATGKSFRTNRDTDMISFGQEVGRVGGMVGETKVEVVIVSPQATGGRLSKKFLMNGVGKSRVSLHGLLPLVLFRPEELDIIIAGPGLRRSFLDEVLEQADTHYATLKQTYERVLRQRNALLKAAQETGKRNNEQFNYWDELLIESGQQITTKRQAFLDFINVSAKSIFPLHVVYDHSSISHQRLDQYRSAEVAAGVTLVGPHRDDVVVLMPENKEIKVYGSRGQQRLAVLQLKMLQIVYLQDLLKQVPLLVLDDIFSELDSGHIQLVFDNVQGMQVILTTTHKEFVPEEIRSKSVIIELEK